MPNPQQGISLPVSLCLICFSGLSNNESISHFSKISNSPFPSVRALIFSSFYATIFSFTNDSIIYFLIFQPFFSVLFKYNSVSHIFYKKYPLLKIPFPLWVPPSTHAASGFIPARTGKGKYFPAGDTALPHRTCVVSHRAKRISFMSLFFQHGQCCLPYTDAPHSRAAAGKSRPYPISAHAKSRGFRLCFPDS